MSKFNKRVTEGERYLVYQDVPRGCIGEAIQEIVDGNQIMGGDEQFRVIYDNQVKTFDIILHLPDKVCEVG